MYRMYNTIKSFVKVTLSMDKEQKQFLDNKSLSLSKLVRKQLHELMEKENGIQVTRPEPSSKSQKGDSI